MSGNGVQAVSGWQGMQSPQQGEVMQSMMPTNPLNATMNATDQGILGSGATGEYAVKQSPLGGTELAGTPQTGTLAALGSLAYLLA